MYETCFWNKSPNKALSVVTRCSSSDREKLCPTRNRHRKQTYPYGLPILLLGSVLRGLVCCVYVLCIGVLVACKSRSWNSWSWLPFARASEAVLSSLCWYCRVVAMYWLALSVLKQARSRLRHFPPLCLGILRVEFAVLRVLALNCWSIACCHERIIDAARSWSSFLCMLERCEAYYPLSVCVEIAVY
jgi:hypothetical protein